MQIDVFEWVDNELENSHMWIGPVSEVPLLTVQGLVGSINRPDNDHHDGQHQFHCLCPGVGAAGVVNVEKYETDPGGQHVGQQWKDMPNASVVIVKVGDGEVVTPQHFSKEGKKGIECP